MPKTKTSRGSIVRLDFTTPIEFTVLEFPMQTTLTGFDPTYLAAKEEIGKTAKSIPKRQIDEAALGLRFTLHLPVTAMFPPRHWELFKMALDLAQAGALVPLNEAEQKIIRKIAKKSEPIFP